MIPIVTLTLGGVLQVMAAIDYARLRDHLQRSRLLFVAHREEILEQSLATDWMWAAGSSRGDGALPAGSA